jgi:hypothetical protein
MISIKSGKTPQEAGSDSVDSTARRTKAKQRCFRIHGIARASMYWIEHDLVLMFVSFDFAVCVSVQMHRRFTPERLHSRL